MKKIIDILAVLALMVSFGCHRHEYHYLGSEYGASLFIDFDWSGYIDIPPGMNILFYPLDEVGNLKDKPIMHQLQYDGGKVSLPYGTYHVVFYNDYTDNILFRGMDAHHTAEGYLAEYRRMPLSSRAPSLYNVAEPDVLYGFGIESLTVKRTDSDRHITVRPTLHTLKLYVHVDIEGMHNVSQADGSINGASEGIMLFDGRASSESECLRIFPFSLNNDGLYAPTAMFLHNDPCEREYFVELAFLLRNNSVKMGSYRYNVTDQVIGPLKENNEEIPPEGIHIHIDGITIDDVAQGGLDAVVDSWSDQYDIELK